MNRKVLRIIIAVIWFAVAILSYTRNEIPFTIIGAILGIIFLVFALKLMKQITLIRLIKL